MADAAARVATASRLASSRSSPLLNLSSKQPEPAAVHSPRSARLRPLWRLAITPAPFIFVRASGAPALRTSQDRTHLRMAARVSSAPPPTRLRALPLASRLASALRLHSPTPLLLSSNRVHQFSLSVLKIPAVVPEPACQCSAMALVEQSSANIGVPIAQFEALQSATLVASPTGKPATTRIRVSPSVPSPTVSVLDEGVGHSVANVGISYRSLRSLLTGVLALRAFVYRTDSVVVTVRNWLHLFYIADIISESIRTRCRAQNHVKCVNLQPYDKAATWAYTHWNQSSSELPW
eukprot:IDg4773t1